jgi:transglutaminase-like putative cysteine protease
MSRVCAHWTGVAALFVSCLAATPAPAQQVAHSVARDGDRVRFEVGFQAGGEATHVLRFAFRDATYEAAKDGLPPLDAEPVRQRIRAPIQAYITKRREAWREALRARIAKLERSLPQHVDIEPAFEGEKLSWRLKSRGVSEADLQRLANRIKRRIETMNERLVAGAKADVERYADRVRDEVYRDLSYLRDPEMGLLRVDYRRVARQAARRLSPLAEAIGERAGADARNRLAYALAFLQTIPYDRLTGRDAADGSGFATPMEMLHLNRGDCDSKATALAALMRRLAPEVRTALILLPGHAVLAADIPSRPGDRMLKLRGERFVLMEPAGPAVVPVGQIAPDSLKALERGDIQSVVWMTG